MSAAKNSRVKAQPTFTYAQALRDIVVAAINKGQLPILGIIAIILGILWKMSSEDAGKLAFKVLESLKVNGTIGWFLVLIIIVFWYLHVKSLRRSFSKEYMRIGKEKTKIQGHAVGQKYKSSDE
jgi:hypothetical protein